jgi:hypothetical protein
MKEYRTLQEPNSETRSPAPNDDLGIQMNLLIQSFDNACSEENQTSLLTGKTPNTSHDDIPSDDEDLYTDSDKMEVDVNDNVSIRLDKEADVNVSSATNELSMLLAEESDGNDNKSKASKDSNNFIGVESDCALNLKY